eukprot:6469087-Amphidinium_carterae.3
MYKASEDPAYTLHSDAVKGWMNLHANQQLLDRQWWDSVAYQWHKVNNDVAAFLMLLARLVGVMHEPHHIELACVFLTPQTGIPDRRAVDKATLEWSASQLHGTRVQLNWALVRRAYKKATVQQSYYSSHTASAECVALQLGGHRDRTCTACGCNLGSHASTPGVEVPQMAGQKPGRT